MIICYTWETALKLNITICPVGVDVRSVSSQSPDNSQYPACRQRVTPNGSRNLISIEYRGQPILKAYGKIIANMNEEEILKSNRNMYLRIIHCRTRIKSLDFVWNPQCRMQRESFETGAESH